MEKEYTKRQLEVINANSGYNMVLAGPGCGKTARKLGLIQ